MLAEATTFMNNLGYVCQAAPAVQTELIIGPLLLQRG